MALMQTKLVKNALSSDSVVGLLKKTIPPLDKALLRISRGRVNTAMQSVVLLETVGAKTGQVRSIATMCMPVDDDLVLVGSNWGQDRDPAWVHNLRANPRARVHFKGFVGDVEARELDGAERAAMWDRLVAFNPQYSRYQESTNRVLPIMRLNRVD